MKWVCYKVKQLWAYSTDEILNIEDISEAPGKIIASAKNLKVLGWTITGPRVASKLHSILRVKLIRGRKYPPKSVRYSSVS